MCEKCCDLAIENERMAATLRAIRAVVKSAIGQSLLCHAAPDRQTVLALAYDGLRGSRWEKMRAENEQVGL